MLYVVYIYSIGIAKVPTEALQTQYRDIYPTGFYPGLPLLYDTLYEIQVE